ncbi:hypothetical protein TSMEX_011041 [Taenia solium]|eukprot:TsM_000772800 transcript=TsM_000772800 gene=TsM_000772800
MLAIVIRVRLSSVIMGTNIIKCGKFLRLKCGC